MKSSHCKHRTEDYCSACALKQAAKATKRAARADAKASRKKQK